MNYIPVLQPGEIEEDRPMPSLNHSIVCQNLGVALAAFRDRNSIHQQLNLNLDGWPTVPDVCVYPKGTLHATFISDQNEVPLPPGLVIEVLSPMQTMQPLLDKIRQYHDHGVPACWIVIPGSKTIAVYPHNGPSSAVTAETIAHPPLGIEIAVSDVFYGIED
jgi:Uma2 family endonuclease